MKMRRVVVTGIGALTPIGLDIPSYWDSLVKGVSGAAPITYFDAAKAKTRFACELKDFDPSLYFDRKELRKYDKFSQYGILAADQAIKDSGADIETLDKDRIGVIWASGIGGITTFQHEVTEFALGDGEFRFSPMFIPKMIADICSGHISIRHDLRGPNFSTVSACASSANAIADAALYIKEIGRAHV